MVPSLKFIVIVSLYKNGFSAHFVSESGSDLVTRPYLARHNICPDDHEIISNNFKEHPLGAGIERPIIK